MQRRIAGCLVVLACGCLDVAEERAERDASIGQLANATASVRVADGLAAVRRLERDSLELWANAPTLSATLTLEQSSTAVFRVRVRNALPEAILSLHRPGGSPVPLRSINTSFGTERRVEFDAESGGTFELRLAALDADATEPFEFLAFADVQEAIDDVGDVFAKMNREPAARFVVMAGDITRRGGADELERFQREQLALRVPIFVTLGNHELGAADVPYHDYFGRGSQSFTFHGARFTLLDSASATIDPQVYDWLDGWLAQGRGRAHFVFMHVPPVDPSGVRNGCFSSRAESNKLIARLARAEVTAGFYGHVHSYYSFEHAGIPAFISGGGGAIPERFDGVGRHYLAVRADPLARTFRSRLVRVD